ncbi:plasmid mobilization protein [Silvibacterium acidisoli]|uniref:plasmid mobilization protein n=1 Tax=Acidobacteriaceae bacterium ZG23-2 TaxID=2883246 RepID=UPI00406D2F33
MPPVQSPAQSMTSPQSFPPTSEALDAVLGRFQAWTSSRKAAGDEVRQLSYEEAVKSTQRRFQAAKAPATRGKLKAEPGVLPVAIPSPASVTEKEVPSKHPKKPAPVAKKTQQAAPEKGETRQARKPLAAKPEIEFRKVLAETVAPQPATAAMTHRRQPESARQVSLSLRLAPAEQAMIRARASAAGISTSAYLRQCALEVEQLREQMRHTLALIGQGAALAVSNSQAAVQTPSPGFLERLKRVFLGGKQARNLSLRA